MNELTKEQIGFISEEQNQLWEEVRHNDRLRWLLFAGWIVAQAWFVRSIIRMENTEKYQLSLFLLVIVFLIGPLIMYFHALERNKSSDFYTSKDILRRAIFNFTLLEKPLKRNFMSAWKGTDGIYSYLLTIAAILTSFYTFHNIIEFKGYSSSVYLYILLIAISHLATYSSIIYFGTKQYSKLSEEWLNLLRRKDDKKLSNDTKH